MVKQLILCIALLCSPAWATWTCADGATGCTNTTVRQCTVGTTTCSITVASTAGGSVGVLCEHVNSATVTVTGSLGGTWTTSTGSNGTGTNIGTECAYNLNMTAGTTSITCTISSSTPTTKECSYFNFTGTGSSFTFDTAGTSSDASCTTCAGAALTLGTSNNYILIQSSHCSQTCSAIDQSYTAIITTASNGMAFKINVSTAGTTPNWTQAPAGTLAGGAMAIYEVTSSCKPTLTLMGVGRCG